MEKSILEKLFSAPAEILEKGAELEKEIKKDIERLDMFVLVLRTIER